MKFLLVFAIAFVGCQEQAPAPRVVEREDAIIRGVDGMPMFTVKSSKETRAVVDLAGQVVGLGFFAPAEDGQRRLTVRDRFGATTCTVTFSGREFRLVDDNGKLALNGQTTGRGVLVQSVREKWTLSSSGIEGTTTILVRDQARTEIVRQDRTLFTVEGPLDPRASLAIALRGVDFGHRVCLALTLDEMD